MNRKQLNIRLALLIVSGLLYIICLWSYKNGWMALTTFMTSMFVTLSVCMGSCFEKKDIADIDSMDYQELFSKMAER